MATRPRETTVQRLLLSIVATDYHAGLFVYGWFTFVWSVALLTGWSNFETSSAYRVLNQMADERVWGSGCCC